MRPGGAPQDHAWTPPKNFTLETVVPDDRGGLYLVAAVKTLYLAKGSKEPRPFCDRGSSPGAACLAPDGSLLLGHGRTVTRVARDGTFEVVADGFAQVFGIAVGRKGTLFVSDWEKGEVIRITAPGTPKSERTVVARGLEYPSGLVLDSKGSLYIKESGRMTNRDATIRRVSFAAGEPQLSLFATVPTISRHRTPSPKKGESESKKRASPKGEGTTPRRPKSGSAFRSPAERSHARDSAR